MAKRENKTTETSRGVLAVPGRVLGAILGPLSRDNVMHWVLLIAVVLGVRWAWFEPFRIPSQSMSPTLHGDPRYFVGDRVAVNKLKYGLRVPFMNKRFFNGADPQRFDIVVFRSVETDPTNKILIKRLMGLPGERIQIRNGKVRVNGKAVEMPEDLKDIVYTDMYQYGVWPDEKYSVVPANHYLMLGDNSSNSRDGRYFGWVPRDNLVGPAFGIWWPLGHRRDFTGFSHTWWGMLLLYGLPLAFVSWEVSRAFFVASWRVRAPVARGIVEADEHVLINRLAFGLRLPFSLKRITQGRIPVRGELVAFQAPKASELAGAILLGHVQGYAGDDLRIENGSLYVNDTIVSDLTKLPKGKKHSDGDQLPRADWLSKKKPSIPEGHYLILSETDEEILDSRVVGLISREHLLGSIACVWRPFRKRRKLEPQTPAS